MARNPLPPLDVDKTLYVRKSFRISGKQFNPGMTFDWKRMALTRRKVTLLHGAGKVTNAAPKPEKQATPEKQSAPKKKASGEPVEKVAEEPKADATAQEPAEPQSGQE